MAGKVNWRDDAFKAQFRAEMQRRTSASAILVENHSKRLLSVDGTGGETRRDERGKFIKGTGKAKIYGSNPSLPGEPPHKQYGHLRRSVTWEIDLSRITARVGTNLRYGRWLELGTAKVAARPWLRRALIEQRARIVRLLTAPMKQGKG